MLCTQAKDRVNDFVKLKAKDAGYKPRRVTPYMHIMYHCPHFIRLYGNIKQFSCQGKNLSESNSQCVCMYSHLSGSEGDCIV